jgi:tetratricopeptide (TPR) repeat protein
MALVEFHLRAPGFVGGDKKKAARTAEEILRLNAARGYLAQALVARHLKQFDRSRELYTRAGEAGNDYVALSAAAYFFLAAPADYRKVEEYARRAIEIDSSRGTAYAPLVAALVHEAKWNDLDVLLAEAAKSSADDLSPFYSAGKALLDDQRDLPRAEVYLRRYLQQEPEAMAPTLAEAHTAQASVLARAGQKAKAIAELRDALRSDPNFEPAARELKRLEKE